MNLQIVGKPTIYFLFVFWSTFRLTSVCAYLRGGSWDDLGSLRPQFMFCAREKYIISNFCARRGQRLSPFVLPVNMQFFFNNKVKFIPNWPTDTGRWSVPPYITQKKGASRSCLLLLPRASRNHLSCEPLNTFEPLIHLEHPYYKTELKSKHCLLWIFCDLGCHLY